MEILTDHEINFLTKLIVFSLFNEKIEKNETEWRVFPNCAKSVSSFNDFHSMDCSRNSLENVKRAKSKNDLI